MVRQTKGQSGFTMVETVAGLAILLILIAIMAVFAGPALLGIPQFTENSRQKAEIAQLQALLIQIGPNLKIPYWWPDSVVEISAAKVRIRDLSKQNTSHEQELPDILGMEYGDGVLLISWDKKSFSFTLPGDVKFSPWQNEQKQTTGVAIAVAEGIDLVLPFGSLPLPTAAP